MVKLYLKKLGSILLYTVLCFFVYFISFNILVSIANIFKTPIFRYGILVGVPVVIAFITVHRFRVEKSEIRRAYLSIVGTEKIGIKSEWRYMTRFSEFIAENIAFATVGHWRCQFGTVVGQRTGGRHHPVYGSGCILCNRFSAVDACPCFLEKNVIVIA